MTTPNWPTLTVYDFLGYFIPGALGVYLGLVVGSGAPGFSVALPALSLELGILFFLVAYVSGHLLSLLSAILVETYAIERYGYPSAYLFGIKARARSIGPVAVVPKESVKASSVLLSLLIFPLVVPDWLIGKKLGLSAKFVKTCDRTVAEHLKAPIRALLKIDKLEEVEFFHLVSHWVREHAPGHAVILQAHVARKGFLRTLTLLLVIGVWLGSVSFSISGQVGYLTLAASCWGASYAAFLAYLKQERRFSLETLMAFGVTYRDYVKTLS